MKIIKSLEESGLLAKSVSETSKNEVKEEKGGFGMLSGMLIIMEQILKYKGKILIISK